MSLTEHYRVSLAGLLHDIGKFLERAHLDMMPNNHHAWSYARNHGRSYRHAAFTARFIDGELPGENGELVNFSNIFDVFSSDGHRESNLTELAATHHTIETQDDPRRWIVAEADRLASGFERRADGGRDAYKEYDQQLEAIRESGDPTNYRQRRLKCIFSEIDLSLNWGTNTSSPRYYPITALEPGVRPQAEATEQSGEESYANLYFGFLKALSRLSKIHKETPLSIHNMFQSIMSLMERYCWAVPAATVIRVGGEFQDIPTCVSLFDHSRGVSAIASGLYAYHKEEFKKEQAPDLGARVRDRSALSLCMIQGSFAGIQNFLFSSQSQSNKYAAKILRAKSFFVTSAAEAAAFRMCDELELPYASIIFGAAGKFQIIAGNTPGVKEAIQRVSELINGDFSQRTFGQARITLTHLIFSPNDLCGGNYQRILRDLNQQAELEKLKPEVPIFVFSDYVKRATISGVCEICCQHPSLSESRDVPICRWCDDYREIGGNLVKNPRYLVFSRGGTDGFSVPGGYCFRLSEKSDSKDLCFQVAPGSDFDGFARKRVANYVPTYTEHDRNRLEKRRREDPDGTGGIGDPKSFQDIAEDSQRIAKNGDPIGSKMIGVLKADVDHLGQMFARGLGNDVNLSKHATLSRMLDYFFTGWLRKRLENTSTYTVFAGGDDLFLIGPWNELIDLAGEIDKRFRGYTGDNVHVHLSAGISVYRPDVPIRQLAADAGAALDAAKDGDGKSLGRDAITVFQRTVKWNRFHQLMADVENLNAIAEAPERRGFLHKVLRFIGDAEVVSMREQVSYQRFIEAAKWPARFAYLIARIFGGVDDKGRARSEKVMRAVAEMAGDYRIPVTYCLYNHRSR